MTSDFGRAHLLADLGEASGSPTAFWMTGDFNYDDDMDLND
jgi:hypothetical protein